MTVAGAAVIAVSLVLGLSTTCCVGQILFSGPQQVTINEELPSGSLVATYSTRDTLARPVTLSVDQVDDYKYFNVLQNGELQTTSERLDRETRTVYKCTLRARNTAGDSKTHSVQVSLRDVNDNSPKFSVRLSSVVVLEDAAVGDFIFQANASDPDEVAREQRTVKDANGLDTIVYVYTISNGRVFYSIASGNDAGKFSINQDTGVVTVNSSLLLDARQQFTLVINATDPDGLHDTADLTIRVGDANDNSPVIFEPLPFNVTISEATAPGVVILSHAYANDTDFGSNAEVAFALVAGNANGEFAVNRTTGRIVLVSMLDYERSPIIHLDLAAQDEGSPMRQSTVRITVIVEDVNDNAPSFLLPSYLAPVSESESPGSTNILSVSAVDPDGPGNGSVVRYSFAPGNDAGGAFSIDPVTGVFQLLTTLDRETTAEYHLVVVASDQDVIGKQQSSSVNVTIVVSDSNDNSPRFVTSPFVGNILDGQVRGKDALQLNATDADEGDNARIQYSILGGDSSSFAVDSATGTVTYEGLQAADYATKRFYNFTARAEDQGALVKRATTVKVVVEVHELNPNAPVFSPVVYSATVNESLPIGTSVLQVTATDADSRQIGEIRYEIQRGDPDLFRLGGSFDVDSVTGVVSVATSLDRDVRSQHVFWVVAKDGGFPPKTSLANLTVMVTDVNDVAPVFPSNMATHLQEHLSSVLPRTIYQVNATDPDLGAGGSFTYALDAGDWPSSLFSIDPLTGVISVHQGLDREAQAVYTITVAATDQGVPSLTGRANLTLYVTDINDQAPYFTANYTASIMENASLGMLVLTVSALDDDVGDNAVSTYRFVAGNAQGHFSVDTNSGDIRVAAALDREMTAAYLLAVEATDAAGFTATVWAAVSVVDINDNAPLFSSSLLVYNVSEATLVNSVLFRLSATDADVGNTLTYNMTETPNGGGGAAALGYLHLSPATGNVTLVRRLDRETLPGLRAVVWVSDGVFTSNATLQVDVRDYNDLVPMFNQSQYSATVSEDVPVNTTILTVTASDADVDVAHRVLRYQILAGDARDWFAIDPLTGSLRNKRPLDRETLAVVNLTVGAINTASPSLTGTASVVITLDDVNDSPPDFGPGPHVVSIAEAGMQGNSAGYVNATDPDLHNSTVWYSIVDDDTRHAVRIDPRTGEITLMRALDYEVQHTYYIVVRAEDRGIPPLSSTTNATLKVIDVNDNHPVFSSPVYTVTVPEDAKNNSGVVQLNATDLDATSNGELTFALIATATDPAPFSVDPKSGLVSVNGILDRETVDIYNLTVTITDSGVPPLSTVSRLEVTIADVNDSPPKFVNASYNATITENTAGGTVVARVHAVDPDIGDNSLVTYSITAGNSAGRFAVSASSGVVHTVKALDREQQEVYRLTVVANNSASSAPATDTVIVTIAVLDLNDNRPHLPSVLPTVHINETLTVGDIVGYVPYVDGDKGPNGRVTFSIAGGNDEGLFRVESSTGAILLQGNVDAETRDLYSVYIHMYDGGSPALSGSGSLYLMVQDANDNPPVFSPQTYRQTIQSVRTQGDDAFIVKAVDADASSQLHYTVTGGTAASSMTLTQVGGVARLLLSVDASTLLGQTLTLQLSVSDGLHTATASVTFFVQNLSSGPRFDAIDITSTIPETTTTRAAPISISGSGSYALAIDTAGVTDFQAVTSSKQVVVNGGLDVRRQSYYHIVLRLVDTATQVTQYTQVRITVSNDVNHYAPVLGASTIAAEIAERHQTFITKMRAEDRDTVSANNIVAWEAPKPQQNIFVIDFAGDVRLGTSLDYDTGAKNYSLDLTASNYGGRTIKSDTATLTFILTEANDNQPIFAPSAYAVSLLENNTLSLTAPIVTAVATDADVGSSGHLTYGLIDDRAAGGGNFDYHTFRIDSKSGQVFQAGSLDWEQHREYFLRIVAQDGGNPGMQATASLSIRVIDINDNYPVFERPSYAVSVHENATLGSTLVTVHATDLDQIDLSADPANQRSTILNGYVTYGIISTDLDGHFGMCNTSGEITLLRKLDVETRSGYEIVVRATDGGGLHTDVRVYVTVLDNNDNRPMFGQSSYRANVSEDAPIGTPIVHVTAMDIDVHFPHRDVKYAIVGGNPGTVFSVNVTSGWITTSSSLDRELMTRYDLIVEAFDQGIPRQVQNVTVSVELLDVNEFAPVFVGVPYTVSIPESSGIGFQVLRVNTTDRDLAENATASYSIQSGNALGHFRIGPLTGAIVVNQSLDFETVKSYNLTVLAQDMAPPGYRLNASTLVSIHLLDVNDNAPVFANASYTISVIETWPINSAMFVVTATDADSTSNGNVLSYQPIFSGSDDAASKFSVNTTTGAVFLIGSLDRERYSRYVFTVRATDGGGKSADTLAIVTVLDYNDNSPVFPSADVNASVPEDASVSTPVVTVLASDADAGANANLIYALVSPQNLTECLQLCAAKAVQCHMQFSIVARQSASHFSVDPLTAIVASTALLDRESVPVYVLVVVATDSSADGPRRNGTTCLSITLGDVNDETPAFGQANYGGEICENLAAGQSIMTVTATDKDIGLNSELVYSLSTTGAGALFSVDPDSGTISSAAVFDREISDLWQFTVTATDKGVPPRAFTVPVAVNITDANDNHPQFVLGSSTTTQYNVTLPEDVAVGSDILQLMTTDRDIGLNAQARYALNSSSSSLFNVTADGSVLISGALDRERQQHYSFVVVANDLGTPRLSSTAIVTVTVTDVNDNSPAFSNATHVVHVREDAPLGLALLRFMVTDADVGSNGIFHFSFASGVTSSSPFSIAADNGTVYLTSMLNAEIQHMYVVNVTATDDAVKPEDRLSTVTQLTIMVVDVNDVNPVFTSPLFQFSVKEGGLGNRSVFRITATDGDITLPNNQVRLSIDASGVSPFIINSTSGLVSLSRALDRETQAVFDFMVVATDGGSPSLRGRANVTVYVLDENDHYPIFRQPEYGFSVGENLPAGSAVGQVEATDLDLNNVTFSLHNDSSADGFAINKHTGNITTLRPLDREVSGLHELHIVAEDGLPLRSPLSSAVVVVTILDENDERPSFVRPEFYNQTIPESLPIGSDVFRVEAVDKDDGSNAVLSYALIPSNDSAAFEINTTAGQISLWVRVDYETQAEYHLEVIVHDAGSPSLSQTASVNITIADVNDNTPRFDSPSGYTAVIDENTLSGWSLQILASDADSTHNARLEYTLAAGNTGGDFHIDNTTGLVTVRNALDYERTQRYNVTVLVEDMGAVTRSATAFLVVTVVDLNDNSPVFAASQINVTVPETTPLYATITNIHATDADSTTNARLRFYLSAGNSKGHFSINEQTGTLSLVSLLDRERQAVYELTVTAEDSGVPSNTASQVVRLSVTDVNDERPVISQGVAGLRVTLLSNATASSVVSTVTAQDLDTGVNAQLQFSILTGNAWALFTIDPQSGVVSTTRALTDMDRLFQLSIGVQDGGVPTQSDRAVLTVTVRHPNTNRPRFVTATQSVSVYASTIVGAQVAFAAAEDSDFPAGASPGLAYSLDPTLSNSTVPSLLSADSRTGALSVSALLVNVADTILTAGVCASDGELSTCQLVHLSIVSSQSLAFDLPSYTFSVDEDAVPTGAVGTVRMPSAAGYSVQHGNDKQLFAISSSGDIMLGGSLDYEAQQVHILIVAALDSNQGELASVAVRVQVRDVNEFAPTFVASQYRVSVSELSFPGRSVLTLESHDGDLSATESSVAYSIVSGNHLNWFTIDQRSGKLSTYTLVDHEMASNVVLNVSATNYASSKPLMTFTTVDIAIADTNDNSPSFPSARYHVSVHEDVPIGHRVLMTNNTDPDSGYNGMIFYAVKHTSAPGLFAVNTSTGAITTTADLNASSVSSVVLTVVAGDYGTPASQIASAAVYITIVPVNRNAPEFSQSLFTVDVSETIATPAVLGVFAATDADGSDALIRYALAAPAHVLSSLTVDELSGALILTQQLSYSDVQSVNVSITATDRGSPRLHSTAVITLRIADENNHNPVFEKTNYTFFVPELAAVGSVVTRLVARDPDTAYLSYAISRNALAPNGQDLFLVNATSGELILQESLDHEIATSYDIEVFALDHGYVHRRSTRQRIRIEVVDENDNYPWFIAVPETLNMSRYLPAGYVVAMVNASDADEFYGNVMYSISAGNDDGLLSIDAVTGHVSVTAQPGLDANTRYNVTIAASDGQLVTYALVDVNFDFSGNFCLPHLCYLTQPAADCSQYDNATSDNMTTSSPGQCGACSAGWLPILSGKACAYLYCSSQSTHWVCAAANSTNGTCMPLEQPCEQTRCHTTHSLCQPTARCLPLDTHTTCDNSSSATTCLVDQALVEADGGVRTCRNAAVLMSSVGRSCTAASMVFCSLRDRCINVNVPDPCVQCRAPLLECPKTGVCTLDMGECCDSTALVYCNYTRSCINASVPCVLMTTEPPSVTPTPNSSPVLNTDLLYVGEVRRDDYADLISQLLLNEGVWVSELLANGFNGQPFANDSDSDILGLAVVGTGADNETGWQYAECVSSPLEPSDCRPSAWMDIPQHVSTRHALLLGPMTRIRPVASTAAIGAVWFKAYAYDGSMAGLQHPVGNGSLASTGQVVTVDPLTTGGASAFSAGTAFIIAIIQPAIEFPSLFNSSLTLVDLVEDTPAYLNDGTPMATLLTGPILKRWTQRGNDSHIPYLPVGVDQLLVSAGNLSDYFDQVRRVNSIIASRLMSAQAGYQPGLVVTFQLPDESGRWQISPHGTLSTWYYIDRVLPGTTGNVSVFVDQRARLRFLPQANFYGRPDPVTVLAWDGVTTAAEGVVPIRAAAQRSLTSVVASTSVSSAARTVEFEVLNSEDRATRTQPTAGLKPIPYRIRYEYDHVFTAVVERSASDLRQSNDSFKQHMFVALLHSISVLRIEPVNTTRSEILFSVAGNALTLPQVQMLVTTRKSVLASLGYHIDVIRDDAYFGKGAGCQPSSAGGSSGDFNYGTLVGDLAEQAASDLDGTPIGIAVTGTQSQQRGTWQYLLQEDVVFNSITVGDVRAVASNTQKLLEHARSLNVSRTSRWLTFPTSLSEQRAHLLRPYDRVRFSPNPDYYWVTGPTNGPSLRVKFWDVVLGGKSGQMNVNTDCYTTLTNASDAPPCQAFSKSTVSILASRLGCDGVAGSANVHDSCCVCAGTGSSCIGCDGVSASNKVRDSCGSCGGDGSSCLACDSVPFSGHGSDDCGVCRGRNTSRDCHGTCFGSAVIDDCGQCVEGGTSRQYNSVRDCAGVCHGNASIDDCGDCTGGTALFPRNYRLDCTGVCGGPFKQDAHCGVCRNVSTPGVPLEYRDCEGTCFGAALRDACGVCYNSTAHANATLDNCGVCGGSSTTCNGCDGQPASGKVRDRCGHCNGHNCGCLRIYDLQPRSGPASGGTRISVQGAGFFVNSSGSSAFDANGNFIPSCGGVVETNSQVTVNPRCLFTGSTGTQLSPKAYMLDQSSMSCIAPLSLAPGSFKLSVRPDDRYNDLEDINARFVFLDTANMVVDAIEPDRSLTESSPRVTVTGKNFVPSADVRCLLGNVTRCGALAGKQLDVDGYYSIVPTSMNVTHVTCQLPEVAQSCRVEMYISIDGQHSGILRTSVGMPTLFTYERSAPAMQTAQFSNGLTTLRVRWDRAITLDSGDLTNCAQVFKDAAALLGDGLARCAWESDSQQAVVVTLSSAGSVSLASRLHTVDNSIRARSQAHPRASVGDQIVVTAPFREAPSATASIVGPAEVPRCGSIVVRGYATGSVGYRSVLYQWSVATEDAETPGFSALQQMASAQSPLSSTLSLNASFFQPDVRYYVHLTVVNALDMPSSPARHPVLKPNVSSSEVDVRITGPPELSLTAAADSVVLGTQLWHSACTVVTKSNTLWQLWRLSGNNLVPDTLVSSSSQPLSTFLLSTSSIGTGQFSAVATSTVWYNTKTGSVSVNTVATKAVSVRQSDLAVVIQGGDRDVSSQEDISLSAVLLAQREGEQFTSPQYRWQCVDGQGIACESSRGVNAPLPLPASAHLSIPAGKLSPNQLYKFSVTVRAGDRSSASATSLIKTHATQPGTRIRVLSSQVPVVYAGQKVALRAWITTSSQLPLNVTWTSIGGAGLTVFNLSDSRATLMSPSHRQQQFTSNSSVTSLTHSLSIAPQLEAEVVLIVAPAVLSTNRKYSVNISIFDGSAATLSSNIQFRVLPPATGGTLIASPASGNEETVFVLQAANWQDEVHGSDLEYRFGVELQTGTRNWLTGWTVRREVSTRLPHGNYPISLEIRSRASTAATASASFPVAVSRTATATDVLTNAAYSRAMQDFTERRDWSSALRELTVMSLEATGRAGSLTEQVTNDGAQLLSNIVSSLPTHLSALQQAQRTAVTFTEATSILSEGTTDFLLRSIDTLLTAAVPLKAGLVELPHTTSVLVPTNPSLMLKSEPILSNDDSTSVLRSLSQIVERAPRSRQSQSIDLLRKATQQVASAMCTELALDEQAEMINVPGAKVTAEVTIPRGKFCTDSSCVDFGTQLSSVLANWGCGRTDGSACQGACVVRAEYSQQASSTALDPAARSMLDRQFPGRDLSTVSVLSQRQLSVSIMHPVSGHAFRVQNQSQPIQVRLPLPNGGALEPGTNFTCAYRALQDSQWSIGSSVQLPEIVQDGAQAFAVCQHNHLTQFAVIRIPVPLPTTPSPPTTPTPSIVPTTTVTTAAATTLATTVEPTSSASQPPTGPTPGENTSTDDTGTIVGAVIGAIICILLILALLYFLHSKKKWKSRVIGDSAALPINNEKSVEHVVLTEVRNRPKTAAFQSESGAEMSVIMLDEHSVRHKIGIISALPTTRLRKLRIDLNDSFQCVPSTFYFLTRDLTDIEPGLEQSKFVSTVYEDTVFIRKMVPEMLSKEGQQGLMRHFCTCGKVAQFECTTCGARGYCSPDCQQEQWEAIHQKECHLLAEQRKRKDILSQKGRRATNVSLVSTGRRASQSSNWGDFLRTASRSRMDSNDTVFTNTSEAETSFDPSAIPDGQAAVVVGNDSSIATMQNVPTSYVGPAATSPPATAQGRKPLTSRTSSRTPLAPVKSPPTLLPGSMPLVPLNETRSAGAVSHSGSGPTTQRRTSVSSPTTPPTTPSATHQAKSPENGGKASQGRSTAPVNHRRPSSIHSLTTLTGRLAKQRSFKVADSSLLNEENVAAIPEANEPPRPGKRRSPKKGHSSVLNANSPTRPGPPVRHDTITSIVSLGSPAEESERAPATEGSMRSRSKQEAFPPNTASVSNTQEPQPEEPATAAAAATPAQEKLQRRKHPGVGREISKHLSVKSFMSNDMAAADDVTVQSEGLRAAGEMLEDLKEVSDDGGEDNADVTKSDDYV
ncbi:uncharacterized protein LOC135823227 isoform X2 [Sycon ciliatum]|uniref:uncharacterized protein LOC135823227 isoform X2 n=1 Tax=Sycon ciliatum TaxID=27933 RepID=UPI0031F69F5A